MPGAVSKQWERHQGSKCTWCNNARACRKVNDTEDDSWHFTDTMQFFGDLEPSPPYFFCNTCQENFRMFHKSFTYLLKAGGLEEQEAPEKKRGRKAKNVSRPSFSGIKIANWAPEPRPSPTSPPTPTPATPDKCNPKPRESRAKAMDPCTTPSKPCASSPPRTPSTPSNAVFVREASTSTRSHVDDPHGIAQFERHVLGVACGPSLPLGFDGALWDAQQHHTSKGIPQEAIVKVKNQVVDLFVRFFDRRSWWPILEVVCQRTPVAKKMVSNGVTEAVREMEASFDVTHSVVIKETAHISRRVWRKLYAAFMYDGEGVRRVLSCGVPFPLVLSSWERVKEITDAFAQNLHLISTKDRCYRMPAQLFTSLLSCKPIRQTLGIADEATDVKLDALGGVDALPVCAYGESITRHVTHFSVTFLQYGRNCRSVWFRHMICLYAGKDTTDELKLHLREVMDDLFSFTKGRILQLGKRKLTLTLVNHMSADLVALFALRGIPLMGSVRCFRCNSTPKSCCCDGDQSCFILIDGMLLIFPFDPNNTHVDFGLHFLMNWAIRVIRTVEAHILAVGEDTGDTELVGRMYAAFQKTPLDRIGLKEGEVSDLRVVGRHIAPLRAVLPSLVAHPSIPNGPKELVDSFCALAPLLTCFEISEQQVDEACTLARKMAHALRYDCGWPDSDNMFPYWHMADVELPREIRYVFKHHGVGVGAFVCQAIEALGHQIKVASTQSGWCPTTFLRKVFETMEIRYASHKDILGIHKVDEDGDEDNEDLYCAVLSSELRPILRRGGGKKPRRSINQGRKSINLP